MISLLASEAILFAAAALLGFAFGWRLYVAAASPRVRAERQSVERLRAALSDAQVRRARGS